MMLCLSSYMLSKLYPFHFVNTRTTINCHQSLRIYIPGTFFSQQMKTCSHSVSLVHPAFFALEEEENEVEKKQESNLKWRNIDSDITETQKQAVSQLPRKMTNRSKALMKRIICFSEGENMPLLLGAWVKAMNPTRADWLSVLKEMKRTENPQLLEVMEYALAEDSFEANVRDYTKLIDSYAKLNLLRSAENAFLSMKNRGFPCDQVTLTVLVHMYSKAGDFDRAKEAFNEIKLLGLPLDKRAYGSMMMAYIRAGMLNLAEELMKEVDAQEIYAGKEVYKALLRAYSTTGNADGAQRVFNGIQLAGIVPDSKLCTLLVNAYCVAFQKDKARSVLENMRTVGVKPSDKSIALMLSAYEKENSLPEALSFLMDLEKDGIVVAEEASEVLARWFRKLGAIHEIERVLGKYCSKQAVTKS